jgi:hypothetical protein
VDEARRIIAASLLEPAASETFQHDLTFKLLVDPALEMKASGYDEAAAEALDDAVDWYRESLRGESRPPAARWRVARALYAAGRWEEAQDAFADITGAELAGNDQLLHHNMDISLLGYQATLAARLGDDETAEGIDRELAQLRRPYLWGHANYWRAAIAAVQGDRENAVQLLTEAMTRGLFAKPWGAEYPKWDYRIDPDFESLRDYPPFQELVGPQG